jgi:ketosteroid isomerase-like protein
MFACNSSSEIETKETWKQEILMSEQQFADMVKEQGIQKAFVKFAAEDAVLMRSDSLIIGKNHYTFTFTDSLGSKNEATGVFHTVWKRQSDGSWRFVWD